MTGDFLAITDRIKAPNPFRVLIGVLIPIIILTLPLTSIRIDISIYTTSDWYGLD